jgi:hypothetical protein
MSDIRRFWWVVFDGRAIDTTGISRNGRVRMADPMWNLPDEEFVRRLHEEQSEADDLSCVYDPHDANLQIEDEPDTSPENT